MATATQRTETGKGTRKGVQSPPPAPASAAASPPPPAAASSVPATVAGSAVGAPLDFSSDSGRGLEGATQESFAIPFLALLQKGSPQVDESSGVALPNAKQGMFFENVTGRLIPDSKAMFFVHCAYRRVFLKWAPKVSGGGFKGEMLPEEVANLRAAGKIVELDGQLYFPDPTTGEIHPDKCVRVRDHRNHYGLLVDEKNGTWTQALVSLTSTQIKKSKALMSALASVKLNGAAGMYTPATWANRIRFSSIPEQNEKGSWMGWRFELDGMISRHDLYASGRAFNEAVRRGNVEVKYEEPEDHTTVDGGGNGAAPGKAGGTF